MPAKTLIKELLKLCKIQAKSEEIKMFSKEFKNHSATNQKIVTVSQFRALVFFWYQISHSTQDLRAKLIQTISDFEEINNQQLQNHEKVAVSNLLIVLKSKLKEMPTYNIRDSNYHDKCIDGLHHIFNYYSKQQFLLGKTPTFDKIKSNTEILTIGKFIRFAKDFRIIKEENKQDTKRLLKMVQKVFISSADCGRYMHEHHFIKGIELLAESFFDKEYDLQNKTS